MTVAEAWSGITTRYTRWERLFTGQRKMQEERRETTTLKLELRRRAQYAVTAALWMWRRCCGIEEIKTGQSIQWLKRAEKCTLQ